MDNSVLTCLHFEMEDFFFNFILFRQCSYKMYKWLFADSTNGNVEFGHVTATIMTVKTFNTEMSPRVTDMRCYAFQNYSGFYTQM